MNVAAVAKEAASWATARAVPGWAFSRDIPWADWMLHGGGRSDIDYAAWQAGRRPSGYRADDLRKAREAAVNANPNVVRKAIESFMPDGPEKRAMVKQLAQRGPSRPLNLAAEVKKGLGTTAYVAEVMAEAEAKRARKQAKKSQKKLAERFAKELAASSPVLKGARLADLIAQSHTPQQRESLRRYAQARTAALGATDDLTRKVASDFAVLEEVKQRFPAPPFRIIRPR